MVRGLVAEPVIQATGNHFRLVSNFDLFFHAITLCLNQYGFGVVQ